MCDRPAEDQDALEIELDEGMKDAQGAAGVIIGLGNDLVQNRQELTSSITPEIEEALPGVINRVHPCTCQPGASKVFHGTVILKVLPGVTFTPME